MSFFSRIKELATIVTAPSLESDSEFIDARDENQYRRTLPLTPPDSPQTTRKLHPSDLYADLSPSLTTPPLSPQEHYYDFQEALFADEGEYVHPDMVDRKGKLPLTMSDSSALMQDGQLATSSTLNGTFEDVGSTIGDGDDGESPEDWFALQCALAMSQQEHSYVTGKREQPAGECSKSHRSWEVLHKDRVPIEYEEEHFHRWKRWRRSLDRHMQRKRLWLENLVQRMEASSKLKLLAPPPMPRFFWYNKDVDVRGLQLGLRRWSVSCPNLEHFDIEEFDRSSEDPYEAF